MTISVIVPIYNTQDYLRECIESLLNQTYKHLEIILIDDGSTDKSPEICDEYALRDDRIRVVHKTNEGVSAARNDGIRLATGDYIAFVDSDDIVDIQMFDSLVNNAQKHGAEISMCNFGAAGRDIAEEPHGIVCMDSYRALKHLYLDMDICFVSFWGKIFRRDFFDDITIPSVRCAEDNYILYKLILKAEKLVFDKKKMYHYRYRENSATKTFDEASSEDFRAFGEQMRLWESLKRTDLHRMCFVRGFKRFFMTMDCARGAQKSDFFELSMKTAYEKFVNEHVEKVRVGFIEKQMYKTDWLDGKNHKIPFYFIRIKDYLRNYRFLKKNSLR